jgi:hypothetical protein
VSSTSTRRRVAIDLVYFWPLGRKLKEKAALVLDNFTTQR